MRNRKSFYTAHQAKNIRMLLAAVIAIIFISVSGCALIPETTESTESTSNAILEAPLCVTAGNKTIQTYYSTRSSYFWNEQSKQWLAADAIPMQYELTKIVNSLPVITYVDDLSLQYGENVTFNYITVFNDTFKEIKTDSFTEASLNNLPEGIYYVIITVNHQVAYVAEGNDYASSSYDCAFKLIVP